MKKIYLACIPALLLLLLSACKKEKPDAYDNLLSGKTWELINYEISGYQGAPFTNGYFTFKPGGGCEYKEINGGTYAGTWDHTYHDNMETHGLYIDVKEHTTQEPKADYFDDIQFTSNYTFIAYVHTPYSVCRFWFRLKY